MALMPVESLEDVVRTVRRPELAEASRGFTHPRGHRFPRLDQILRNIGPGTDAVASLLHIDEADALNRVSHLAGVVVNVLIPNRPPMHRGGFQLSQ